MGRHKPSDTRGPARGVRGSKGTHVIVVRRTVAVAVAAALGFLGIPSAVASDGRTRVRGARGYGRTGPVLQPDRCALLTR